MKVTRSAVLLAAACLLLSTRAAEAIVDFNLSPSSVTNDYRGPVALTVSGISPQGAARVERFLDLNNNGILETNLDLLVQSFLVTDGEAAAIGGIRNPNVPGDEDLAGDGVINSLIYPANGSELSRLAGNYLVRISSPSAAFPSVVHSFTVTPSSFAQAVQGRVMNGSVGEGLAMVVLLTSETDQNFRRGAVADAQGNFSIPAPPGTYRILAIKRGFVGTLENAPIVVLSPGVSSALNPALVAAPRFVSGYLRDSDSGAGLPGVAVFAVSTNGFFTAGTSDGRGSFNVPVSSGVWRLEAGDTSLPLLGYLPAEVNRALDTSVAGVPGVIVEFSPVNALVHGLLRNGSGNPLPYTAVNGHRNANDSLNVRGFTDANGIYVLGVLGDSFGESWHIRADADELGAQGLVPPNVFPNVIAGQAYSTNLDAVAADAHLRGTLVDENGVGVADATLWANDYYGSPFSARSGSSVTPGAIGQFDIGVVGGSFGAFWDLQVESDDTFARTGLIAPASFFFVITNTDQNNIRMIARRATVQINGVITNSSGAPVPHMGVTAYISDHGTNYNVSTSTDQNGAYRLNLFRGTNWSVSVDSGDLSYYGYNFINSQTLDVSANRTLNFVARPFSSSGQVDTFGIVKGQVFEQTIDHGPLPHPTLGFAFDVFVDSDSSDPVSSGTLKTPGGISREMDIRYGHTGLREKFASQADLDAVYGTGTYLITLNSYFVGRKTINVPLAAGTYPNSPRVANLAAAQDIKPRDGFVLTWDPFVGGRTSDFIQLTIEDDQGHEVFQTPTIGSIGALNGTATSHEVGFFLSAGKHFHATLMFARITPLTTTAFPGAIGAAGYFSQTQFDLKTTGGDVKVYGIRKGQEYFQTGTGAPALDVGYSPFNFSVYAYPTDPSNPILGGTVLIPGGTTRTLLKRTGDTPGYEYFDSFDTQVEIDTLYPQGVYSLLLSTSNDGNKTNLLTLSAPAFPVPPHIANYDEAQEISSGDDFILRWDPFLGATTNDLIQLWIYDSFGDLIYRSGDLPGELDSIDGTTTSFTIPGYTLLPGEDFDAYLAFERTTSANLVDYPGAIGRVGYVRETWFPMSTLLNSGFFPVARSSQNEVSYSFAYDGRNFAVVMTGDNDAIRVQLLSGSGTPVGAPIPLGQAGANPKIAFDGANYLIAWNDLAGVAQGNIFGQFIAKNGSFVGSPFPITQAAGRQELSDLAFGGGHYLAIWEDNRAGTDIDLYGQFVGSSGLLEGGEIPFTVAAEDQRNPVLAYDGNRFLAAWLSRRSGPELWDVQARFVQPGGSLSTPFTVSQTTSGDYNPMAIAFDGNQYLVVWNRNILSGSSDIVWDIFGRFVSKTGTFPGNEIPIATASGDQILPSVAWDGNNYLITWLDIPESATFAGEIESKGRFFTRAGAPIDYEFTVFNSSRGKIPLTAPLIFDGQRYLAVSTFVDISNGAFDDGDIFGNFINSAAPTIDSPPESEVLAVGDDIFLWVDASGAEPLQYQWFLNGAVIPGETSLFLYLPDAQITDSGNYAVRVSNGAGSVTSAPATIDVLRPPVILSVTPSKLAGIGDTVTFTVTADGSGPLFYQWSRNGDDIPGAQSPTLTISNVQIEDFGAYSVTVENDVDVADSYYTFGASFLSYGSNPLNFSDNFAGRLHDNTDLGIGSGSNVGTGTESGEPLHANKRGGRSAWYSWTAPADGVATFTTWGSSFDTILAVYTGNAVNNLTPVASDDDSGGYLTSLVLFRAVAGTEYQIAIDGYGGATGFILLSWELDTTLTDVPQIVAQPPDQTVLLGSNVTFGVWAQAQKPLTYQWYHNGDPIPGETRSNLTFAAFGTNAGAYRVDVSNGDFTIRSAIAFLEITTAGAASQDKFADIIVDNGQIQNFGRPHRQNFASVSAGSLGSQILDNFGSSTELGEPAHAGVRGGASRWFNLKAEDTGIMVIDTIGSDLDTVLAVYTGTNLFALTEIASDDDGAPDGIRSLVKFPATNGVLYRVAVDGVNGAQGHINLNWKLGIAPHISPTPTNQTVRAGDAVRLTGAASGVPAPGLQWRFNGVPIAGATNDILLVNNFDSINSGTYTLVASNYAGTASAAAAVALVGENVIPRVSIISPASNQVYNATASMVITATASDGRGDPASKVEFFANGTKIGESTSAPFSCTWTTLFPGTITLTAVATDLGGLTNISKPVPVQVSVPESIRPTVTISTPAANARVPASPFNVTGKAADNAGVAQVLVQLGSGPYQPATGASNWAISLNLAAGTNIIRVKSVDTSGNSSLTNTRSFYYAVSNQIILTTGGAGTLTPNLNGQNLEITKRYKITATPAAGQLFSNWSGTISATNPALSFVMQSNLTLQANFVPNPFIPVRGVYNGIFFETAGVGNDRAGFFTLTLADKGTFSGRLTLRGVASSFIGAFDLNGRAQVRITRAATPPNLLLTLQLDISPNSSQEINGTVAAADASWSAQLTADRATFSATTRPAPFAGRYTLVLPGEPDPATSPAGSSIGTVTVDASGAIRLTGTLADGTAVSQATVVSKDGYWPLYLPVYTGRGSLIAWLLFNTNAPQSIGGSVSWIKGSGVIGKYYVNGFSNTLSSAGSIYQPPATGARALDLTNALSVLSGGNLSDSMTNTLVLTNNLLKFTGGSSNRLSLTITTASGLVSGTFLRPGSAAPIPIKGILLQNSNSVEGFFLGTNQSGHIKIIQN